MGAWLYYVEPYDTVSALHGAGSNFLGDEVVKS